MSGQESSRRGRGTSPYNFSQTNAGHRLHAAANQRRVDDGASFAAVFSHISVTDVAGKAPHPPPPQLPLLTSPSPQPLPACLPAVPIHPTIASERRPSTAVAIATAPTCLPPASNPIAATHKALPVVPTAAAIVPAATAVVRIASQVLRQQITLEYFQNHDKAMKTTIPWKDPVHHFSGIPPHVAALHDLMVVRDEQRLLVNKFIDKMRLVLDERGIEGGHLTVQQLQEILGQGLNDI